MRHLGENNKSCHNLYTKYRFDSFIGTQLSTRQLYSALGKAKVVAFLAAALL